MKKIAALILVLCSNVLAQDIQPHFDQPVQADKYLIRPGDQLTVTFLRANIEPLKLIVDPEGRIIHSNLGKFELSDHTLAESKEILKTAIKTLYKVENVVISITDPLLVSFSVTGTVASPGSYQGYTSERVSDAVKRAGGIGKGGSSRQIRFIGGPADILVDLDLAKYAGELEHDPCLYMGFKILVPPKTNERIQVIGEVNDPREIELLPGDNLSQLITLAGGFRGWADTNNIQIIRDGSVTAAAGTVIESGDIIRVNPLSNLSEFQNIEIFGAVPKGGRYKSGNATSLGDLLKLAGGYDSRAVKERIAVFRYSPLDANGRLSITRVPIQNLFSGTSSTDGFPLLPGDSVFVPFSVGYVEVSGLVLNPGIFPYQPDKSADFYIGQAGGYLPEANRTEIGVFDSITHVTNKVSPKVKSHDGSRIVVSIRKELE